MNWQSPKSGRRFTGTIVAVLLAAVAVAGLSASAAGKTAPGRASWLVLGSTRTGATRAYSMRPSGSRLTPLLRPSRGLEPLAVSGNGRTVAYKDRHSIYVSRADGRDFRRVVRGVSLDDFDSASLSSDGKRLAFTSSSQIFVVGTDGRGRRRLASGSEPAWSPDGKALVFAAQGSKRCAVVVQPLQGARRVLVHGACSLPKWSPNGRWIAYEADAPKETVALWVVSPSGKHRHRVARIQVDGISPYSWSRDGTRLAFADYSNFFVVGVDGAPRRLRLSISPPSYESPAPLWSPDGRRLIFAGHAGDDPDQIWVVGREGRGLRRLTREGANTPLGWTRLDPMLPPAAPIPPNERVLGPKAIATRKPVTELSADGGQVAFVAGTSLTDCEHVSVWTPAKKSIQRVSQYLPAPCSFRGGTGLVDYSVYELALAGSRVAWADIVGCGNSCDVAFSTATLSQPRPLLLDDENGEGGAGGGELFPYNVHGDGDLLVFNLDGVVRIDSECGPGHRCKTLRTGPHTFPVESVSGHLIAVREATAVAVLDDQGSLVNVLPFGRNQVKAARVDGSRVIVARSGVLEIYDAMTGATVLQRPLPAGYALTDVDGGIAVLRQARTILLLRLDDGRSLKLTPARGPVLADLDELGLYYSYAAPKGRGHLVFVPRAELERRLGSPAQRAFDSVAGRAAGTRADRLLLSSNRDGTMRTYSVAPDGSRLTPLFPPGGGRLDPVAVSRDGSTIAYSAGDGEPAAIYVARADGSGLRRVAKKGQYPAFSPNGKLLAFVGSKGIWLVAADGRGLRRLAAGDDPTFDWSPSGKAVVFMRVIDQQKQRFAVVVQPLRGKSRVLVRTGPNDEASAEEYQPDWSPDGRWIAYVNREDKQRRNGLTLIRPNGKNRHRIVLGQSEEDTFDWSPDGSWIAYQDAPELDYILPSGRWHKLASRFAGSLAWSPDGKKLAYTVFAGAGAQIHGELVVAGGDGRGSKRLRLEAEVYLWQDPVWSPDSSRIAFGGSTGHDPIQLWVVGSDGSGLLRLTSGGVNFPIAWTGLAPLLSPAEPLPPTEHVLGTDSVATSTPVAALSADGGRVAFAPRPTATDCEHVVVWTPGAGLDRLGNLPAPCGFGSSAGAVRSLAFAGSRAAWVSFGGEGDVCGFALVSATLADTDAQQVSRAELGTSGEVCKSTDIDHVRGDGDLLVFNDEPSHASWLVRVGAGGEKCGELLCTTLGKGAQAAPVASVSGGLIAIRKPGAVAVLDEHGTLVRFFSFAPADVNAALLDGGRLVVWRFGVLEVYDVATGARMLSRPLPPGYRLEDVEDGIAVLLRADTIMLLRLEDGNSFTLTPAGVKTLADLEPPGLYYSYATGDGGGRVMFVPRSNLVWQLGSSAQ